MMVFGFGLSPNHAVIHGMFHVLPRCLSLGQKKNPSYSETLAALIWYKAVILEEV